MNDQQREALRDRLAMYAMPIAMDAAKDSQLSQDLKTLARAMGVASYVLADAMLAAREES